MILDVGCGDNPRGHVNCNLHKGHTFQGGDQKRGIVVNPKVIRNFVLCDCHFLPFRTNGFEKVVCNHLIEHIRSPINLLVELIRVAEKKVMIKTPHRFSRGAKSPFHIHFFNKTWFYKALKTFQTHLAIRSFSISVNYELCFPFFIGFKRIKEIVVEVFP